MNKIIVFACILAVAFAERSFEIKNQTFYMNGKPFQYVSGSFHYFRVHPDRWEDVFQKMVAGGLNAVQTYVAWNVHEPQKGVFNFEGFADIERWFNLAEKYGLYVILRPGPYICAEWDFGGLPWWLLNEKDMEIRVNNKPYLQAVDDWFKVLLPKVAPHLYKNGGNIITVQIENEYGEYDMCDKVYMKHLVDINHEYLGNDTILFTMDPPNDKWLPCGNIEGAYMASDFGVSKDVTTSFETLRKYEKVFPLTNPEFYPGWLDHWKEEHHRVPTEDLQKHLDFMLSVGANVNFYMYIGGTNFAFYSGANSYNDGSHYQSDPTNYDYDAPLSECTDVTSKWAGIRDVIKKHIPIRELEVKNSTKIAYGDVKFTQSASFWDVFDQVTSKPYSSEDIPSMESIGCDFGYVLYTTEITETGTLYIESIKDQAYVYVNHHYVTVRHRTSSDHTYKITETGTLEILVENLGRVNYGHGMFEQRGLPKGVQLNNKVLKNWISYVVSFKDISKIGWKDTLSTELPVFYKTNFSVKAIGDTFLNYKTWGKGVAWINNFNLGRYWKVGPQFTLYIPSPLIKIDNELIIFETEVLGDKMILQDYPIVG